MDTSRRYLKLVCSQCGTTYHQQARVFRSARWQHRCSKCRKQTYTCTTCGQAVSRGYSKCKSCAHRGPIRLCSDCQAPISQKAHSRCRACHNKHQNQGRSTERTKFNNSESWKRLRNQCFADHDYTCVVCQCRGGYIEAHHVRAWSTYPELRLSAANLIVLCRACHLNIHHGRHRVKT